MKEKLTPDKLMKIVSGIWAGRALCVSIELELFTKIAEGKNTTSEIAKELKLKERPVEMLLNACTALGLLIKEDNNYKNTDLADKFLVKGKPTYYGDMITHIGTRSYDAWGKLKESVLTNKPVGYKLSKKVDDKDYADTFTKAMHNNAITPAKILAKKIDFSRYSRLLDLGGGSGAYALVLTEKYPNLKATVFDLKNVCEIADKFIKESNSSKVNTLVGDFFKDEIPKGYDIILLSQILHSFSSEKNKKLLKKVYDALPNQGLLIINEFLLNDEKSGPLFPALFALNMLLQSPDGNSYSGKEISSWLAEIGFKNIKIEHLVGPVSSVIATK